MNDSTFIYKPESMKKLFCKLSERGSFLKRALLLMSAGLLTHAASMAYDFEVDGWYYNITSDTTAELTYETTSPTYAETNYDHLSGEVTIPASVEYDGSTYAVTAIGKYAFWWCQAITDVTIPESVTSIGIKAFWCSSLTQVTIPKSVIEIGDDVFGNCEALTSINLSVDNEYYCVVDGVLYDKNMTELICHPACKQDESFEIPSSVTSIASYSFAHCSALTSVTIPDSVTEIGHDCFFYCTALTSVTLGSNLIDIGFDAFYMCTALTEIYSANPTPPTAGLLTFFKVDTENCVLYVPEGSYKAYAAADYWTDFLNIVEVDFGGIEEITSDNADATEIARYDINGRLLSEPQQGINIVRYSDGTVEKVIVK